MLINEIVLVELKYIPNKKTYTKVTKMDGRSYNWDVANMRFTDAKTGDIVSNNLFCKIKKQILKHQKGMGKGVLTRAADALGFGKDVAQKAMNDLKASIGQKAGAKVGGWVGKT